MNGVRTAGHRKQDKIFNSRLLIHVRRSRGSIVGTGREGEDV